MDLPWLNDLRAQRAGFRGLLWKLLLFGALFLVLDRCLGFLLKTGLDRYYGLDQPARVLCLGHSHVVLGIDKVTLEQALGVPVAKFAVEGANTGDRLIMLRHYFARQPESVRVVVYGVDPHTFTSEGLSSASYRLLFPFIGDPAVGGYIRRHSRTPLEYWLRQFLMLPRYQELTFSFSLRGWLGKWTNLKNGQVDIPRLRKEIERGQFRRIALNEDNLRLFEETMHVAREHGAVVVLLYLPTVDAMNGAEPEKHARVVAQFRRLAQEHAGVVFLDYNKDYESRHELFYDPIHLNPQGQKVVTARLAADMEKLLTSTPEVSGRAGPTTVAGASEKSVK